MAKRKVKRPKDPLRVELSRMIGKIVAHKNVGNLVEAQAHARSLVCILKQEGLISASVLAGLGQTKSSDVANDAASSTS